MLHRQGKSAELRRLGNYFIEILNEILKRAFRPLPVTLQRERSYLSIERPSGAGRERVIDIQYPYQLPLVRERRRGGGWAHLGVLSRLRWPCASDGSRVWGQSGARALRKYACDAKANWETVHASGQMGRVTTSARMARRARVKKLCRNYFVPTGTSDARRDCSKLDDIWSLFAQLIES
eukprot:2208708-Pleurochrysis_carterae.AAC.1